MANVRRENRMNLAALQRVDSTITKIVDNATQVALYNFCPKKHEWEKTEIEGTLFVYNRSEPPRNGFIVMNRLNTTNLVEPLTRELDFQMQPPFMLYRNAKTGDIRGIWFYNKDECGRIGQLVRRLATMATPERRDKVPHVRQRCSSETDSLNKSASKNEEKTVDIVSLLSRAQDEYDKRTKVEKQGASAGGRLQEPKVMLEDPCMEGPKSKDIIRPKPVRATNGVISGTSPQCSSASGTPSVVHLLAHACANQSSASENEVPRNGHDGVGPVEMLQKSSSDGGIISRQQQQACSSSSPVTSLQKLMSNPANMVEHIERIQLNETAATSGHRVRATSFSGSTGLASSESNPSAQSLELDLKEKLHLLPKTEPVAILPAAKQSAPSPPHSPTVIFNLSPVNASPVPNNHYGSIASAPSKVSILPTGLLPPCQSVATSSVPILTPAMFESSVHYSPPQPSPLGGTNSLPVNMSASSSSGALNGVLNDSSFSRSASAIPPPAASVPLLSPMVFTKPMMSQSSFSSDLTLGRAPISLPIPGNSSMNSSLLHGGLPRSDVSSSELLLPQQIEAPLATPNHLKETISQGVTPLTKDQLKEALVHMLHNDDDFLGKIHEAYISTLKTRLNRFSS